MSTALTGKNGEIWIQPDGPNTNVTSMGQCAELSDLVVPDSEVTPVYCRDINGDFIVKAEKKAAPAKVTASVTILSEKVRSYLDRLGNCRLALYFTQGPCSKKNSFGAYDIATAMGDATREGRTYSNMVQREAEDETTLKADFSAYRSSYFQFAPLTPDRMLTASAANLDDVTFNTDTRCAGDCGAAIVKGQIGAIVCDHVGAATADVLFTQDGGITWAAGAADPFAVSLAAMAIVQFPFGSAGGRRWIAGMEAPAGAQGMVAYSDNMGTSWTTVNIGGAVAGHGVTKGGGLFALDEKHIWLVGAAGYIYFSADGGVTWTVQEPGVITAGAYTQVFFIDANYGMAVAAAGVVAITRDGGLHWVAATVVTGAPALNTCSMSSTNRLWAGTATGLLFYSNDFGTTWAGRTGWTGSGVGQVRDIQFLNEYVGWMVVNSAAPVGTILRTINGGFTWEALTTPPNVGLNEIWPVNENLATAVGLVSVTGVIIQAAE